MPRDAGAACRDHRPDRRGPAVRRGHRAHSPRGPAVLAAGRPYLVTLARVGAAAGTPVAPGNAQAALARDDISLGKPVLRLVTRGRPQHMIAFPRGQVLEVWCRLPS